MLKELATSCISLLSLIQTSPATMLCVANAFLLPKRPDLRNIVNTDYTSLQKRRNSQATHLRRCRVGEGMASPSTIRRMASTIPRTCP